MKKHFFAGLMTMALTLSVCAQGTNAAGNDASKYKIVAPAVDLGLSVKWAGWNVGAAKQEEYGGYFGWADPTGVKTSQSNGDYPSANPPQNICGTEYDAAHVHWGGSWRLPTREEQLELVNNCTWTRATVNGIPGYWVSGNGNRIFLPAGGGRAGTNINCRGSGADFWSGTLSTNTEEAYYMWFYGGRRAVEDLPRNMGFSIRPVTE